MLKSQMTYEIMRPEDLGVGAMSVALDGGRRGQVEERAAAVRRRPAASAKSW